MAVAHGQMNEHPLEKIMVDFWDKPLRRAGVDHDRRVRPGHPERQHADRGPGRRLRAVPVCTSCAAGSGRGRERGYTYFLYPPEKPLSETAHERLATVAQHTEMGAGMYVALKDLEIRGAGNLLGGEQSGHIAGVGFDLYVRMIGEAVSELRGDGPGRAARGAGRAAGERAHPARVRARRAAPAGGVYPDRRDRLRRDDLAAVRAELTDRFGPPPEPVLSLLAVARLRSSARQAGLTDITQQGNHIRFAPVELPESREVRVQRLYPRTLLKPAVRTMLVPVPRRAARRRARRAAAGGRSGPGHPLGARPIARSGTALLVRGARRGRVRRAHGGQVAVGRRREEGRLVLRTSMKMTAGGRRSRLLSC